MHVDQIKEKFGGLRWYAASYGLGSRVIDVYEHISYNVCISCGKAENVRITRGWISPVCWKDVFNRKTKDAFREEDEATYLPEGEEASWEKSQAARTVGEYVRVIGASSAASTSSDMKEMLSKWEWETYSGKSGEKKTVNKAIGLLDGTPAPNGQPVWARRVIEDIAFEIERREKNGVPDEVLESLNVLGLNRASVPAWYAEDEENER